MGRKKKAGWREGGRKERDQGGGGVGNFSLTVHTGALTDARTHAADTCCSSRSRGTIQVTHTEEEEVEHQPEGGKRIQNLLNVEKETPQVSTRKAYLPARFM